jgi:hypothetical protein
MYRPGFAWVQCLYAKVFLSYNLFLFSSYPYLTKWGSVQRVLHHVVIKIRQLFLRPATCLTSTPLETGVGANDWIIATLFCTMLLLLYDDYDIYLDSLSILNFFSVYT